MATPEHLEILEQGVEEWNAWWEQHNRVISFRPNRVEKWNAWREQHRDIRPDLSGANLSAANLSAASFPKTSQYGDLFISFANFLAVDLGGANLGGANLRNANLGGANLSGANLGEADLRSANLRNANLDGANLREVNLSRANLDGANLDGANLDGANLSHAQLFETVFVATNLTGAQGLETCIHHGPSTLDHRTLAKSGPLHVDFLRGCGLRDWEIEGTKLYQPGLTSTQIEAITSRVHALRADLQYYSCFISHARRDKAFTKRLHADLKSKGVPCWYAPEDMRTGDRIRDMIEQQIRDHEKLLVVLSSASIASRWVENEVEAALEEEQTSPERRTMLVPIKIDDAVEETDRAWARTIKRTCHIRDFTQWDEDGKYQQAFDQLLQDLKAAEHKPDGIV